VGLANFFGTKDFGKKLVDMTEGVENIAEACAKITTETGVTVNPIPLRNMVRANLASASPRIRKNSTLAEICTRGRGRPAKTEEAADEVSDEPADVANVETADATA
jgi:hypothetical protein